MNLSEHLQSVNIDLLKSKLFYFFFMGAMGTLVPYTYMYYKHTLLLSPVQTVILFTVRSMCLLVASPLLGTIADKLNRFKNILLICLVGYLVTYAAVALVDPIEGFNCKTKSHANKVQAKLSKLQGDPPPFLVKRQTERDDFLTTILRKRIIAGRKSHSLGMSSAAVSAGDYYHGGFLEDSIYSWPFTKSEYEITGDLTKPLFVTILVIIIIGELISSPANTFADVYTLQTLGRDGSHNYGIQIIMGVVGQGITSGFLIALMHAKFMKEESTCLKGSVLSSKPFFYVFFVFIAASLAVASFFNFHRYKKHGDETSNERLKRVFKCKFIEAIGPLLSNASHSVFLFVVLACGIGDGAKSAFLYTFLHELRGEHQHILPIITAVHITSHLLFLALSPMLLKRFGHINIIYAGLLTYSLSFILYSIIDNAWLVLTVEPFDGLARQLTKVAIITYVGSPPEIGAALQGFTHGIYIGLGVSIGGFLCGIIVYKYGYVAVFISLGLSYLLILSLYLGVNHISDTSTTIAEVFTEYYGDIEADIESDYELVNIPEKRPLINKEPEE